MKAKKILVTGAAGYIGGRLIPSLLEKGYAVNALIRHNEDVSARGWNDVQVYRGDVLDICTLYGALENVSVAYYLIHSMSENGDFQIKDRIAASNFAEAARQMGVERIIYLSGLGSDRNLSKHLKSRQESGKILGCTGIPVTEFRAAQVIGSGSISFELIRYLTERLPIILSPQWINSKTQPVAVNDVIYYLSSALTHPETTGKIIEIGGADIVTYKELISTYAELRGLKRPFISLPFLSPSFFAFWVNIITPIPRSIARPLLEGIKNDVIITECGAGQYFSHNPLTLKEAIRTALEEQRLNKVTTFWSLPQSEASFNQMSDSVVSQREGLFIDEVSVLTSISADELFKKIICLGGGYGWPSYNLLWSLRGYTDQFFGGSGKLRGRRCMIDLRPGDPIDFFTVEALEKNRLLRLKVDLKMPGEGWLEFLIEEQYKQRKLIIRAYFNPKGTRGLLYWKALLPFHKLIFKSTLEKITKQ